MKSISTIELKNLLTNSPTTFSLVDVREDFERATHHIGGIHIPLPKLMSKVAFIPTEGNVVFYCARGIRSATAIRQLENHPNAHNFYNLEEGIIFWEV